VESRRAPDGQQACRVPHHGPVAQQQQQCQLVAHPVDLRRPRHRPSADRPNADARCSRLRWSADWLTRGPAPPTCAQACRSAGAASSSASLMTSGGAGAAARLKAHSAVRDSSCASSLRARRARPRAGSSEPRASYNGLLKRGTFRSRGHRAVSSLLQC